ncbi:hypothetical protein GQ42DRAFT_177892 [Ramicandelaber brevisporus]|nr:hypothetical protein GQ42DRAFT_177892 [Ramicandelaber brevisporus]
MHRLERFIKKVTAKAKRQSTASEPLVPAFPLVIKSSNETLDQTTAVSQLLRLPPELLRMIWQFTNDADPWRQRLTCRILYEVLTDLAWRDQLPFFVSRPGVGMPNLAVCRQYGHLARYLSTPRVLATWPHPRHWPDLFPNVTWFAFDMHSPEVAMVMIETFDECIKRMANLQKLECVVRSFSLTWHDQLLGCMDNLVSWMVDGKTLPRMKRVIISYLISQERDQALLTKVINAFEPVKSRDILRIKLRTQQLIGAGDKPSDVSFETIAEYLDAFDYATWDAKECYSAVNGRLLMNAANQLIQLPHLRNLRLFVCNCGIGDYSQWNPSTFPCLQSLSLSGYSSHCATRPKSSYSFTERSSAAAMFEHQWPNVRKFTFNSKTVPPMAFKMTSCMTRATFIDIKVIVSLMEHRATFYIDTMSVSTPYLRELTYCGENHARYLNDISLTTSAITGTRYFPHLYKLSLGHFNFADGGTFAAILSLPSLAHLTLTWCTLNESEVFVKAMVAGIPKGGCGVRNINMNRGRGCYEKATVIAIGQHCPRLQKLNISRSSSPDYLNIIKKSLPNIEITDYM